MIGWLRVAVYPLAVVLFPIVLLLVTVNVAWEIASDWCNAALREEEREGEGE